MNVESLESRIAPAAVFLNSTKARYTDVDGDAVMVTFSKPILTAANVNTVLVTSGKGLGDQLETIDLLVLAQPQDAKGTSITASRRSDDVPFLS